MRTVSYQKALYALYSPYGVRCTLYTSYAQGVQNPKSHEIHAFHNYFECKLFLFECGERATQIDWASAYKLVRLGSRFVEHVSGDVVKNANFECLNWR